jgi:hypothetical protein
MKNAALLDASKKDGPEVNTKKTKCMFISDHQNVGHHNLMAADKSFANMPKFKYLGMTITNQHFIHEGINRFNMGTAYNLKFRIFHLPFSCLRT